MSLLVHDLVHEGVIRFGERIATVDDDSQKTFDQLWERSCRLAQALVELGVKSSDRVVGVMHNRSEWLEIDSAVSMIGAIRARMNSRDSVREFAWILNDVRPSVVIAGPELVPQLQQLITGGTVPSTRLIGLGESGDYEQLIAQSAPFKPRDFDSEKPYVIMHTSGTTGNYKGAVYTHRQWLNAYRNLLATVLGNAQDGAFLHVAPLSHQSGLFSGPSIYRGMKSVMMSSFSAERFFDLVEMHRITHTVLAPTIVNLLASHPDAASRDLSSLRSIIYAGSPIAEAQLRKAIDLFGPILTQGYGTSEAGTSYNLLLSPEDHSRGLAGRPELLTSAGRANPFYSVKVADDTGREVAAGEVGEVWVSGDSVSKEYWGQPEATLRTYRDGWFSTGDVAVSTSDGYVTIIDRKHDMIVSGGLNVYPREVEDVIAAHPSVLEAIVVGVPHDKWGEAVAAFVSLQPGKELSLADLTKHCRDEGLASYKKPLTLEIVDELPKTAAGKLSRRVLRDPFWVGKQRQIG